MTFEVDVPDDLGSSGGNFLKQAGTYHLIVTAIYEGQSPKNRAGEQKIIDGFAVVMDVLDGTVQGQKGKTINATFFNGKLTSKDQGRFARVKQSAFLVATNVIDPSKRGQKVSVDLNLANGQQLIARFEEDEESRNDQGECFLRVSNADTWHVDDPRGEAIPKDQAAIKLIPGKFRHVPEWFDQLKPAKAGDNESRQGQQQRQTAGAGAGSSKSNVSFDDL